MSKIWKTLSFPGRSCSLSPWLGEPRVDRGDARFTLKYRFTSEEAPQRPMRLKIEINTGEHLNILGHVLSGLDRHKTRDNLSQQRVRIPT